MEGEVVGLKPLRCVGNLTKKKKNTEPLRGDKKENNFRK
jgi:hypothetical protein